MPPADKEKEAQLQKRLRTILQSDKLLVMSHFQNKYWIGHLCPEDVIKLCWIFRYQKAYRVAPMLHHKSLFLDARRRLRGEANKVLIPGLLCLEHLTAPK